jgi:methylphosphotriester-DNA--protein-cysteine methyltransferase
MTTRRLIRYLVTFVLIALAFVLLGCSVDKNTEPKNVYVASRNREPFHVPSCKWAKKIKPANRQTFLTKEAAVNAGHRPCKVCRP